MLQLEFGPFPSFSRRGGCATNKKIPFLSCADGVVNKFRQNKVRYATFYWLLISASPYRARASRPSARLRMLRSIYLIAQPPLLEKEGNGPLSQPTSFLPPRLATCGTVLRSD